MKNKKKKSNKPTSKHYQLKWNLFESVKLVEEYVKVHGEKPIPFTFLRKLYSGNLLHVMEHALIGKYQRYGVTFFSKLELKQGGECIVERGFRIDEPMSLTELIDGKDACYVSHGNGLKTKGWVGAKDAWVKMMDSEYPDDLCVDAWAVANCLVRV